MNNFTISEQYQSLVPVLSKEEYDTLKQSIKENGLWMPILVNEQNVILDGHNRFKICQELDIPVKHAIRKFSTQTDEIIYDPFMGSGTFGVSAKKLGRLFIGCEINETHFDTARRLISNA